MEHLLNVSKTIVFMALLISLLDCMIENDDQAEGIKMLWTLSVLAAAVDAISGIF